MTPVSQRTFTPPNAPRKRSYEETYASDSDSTTEDDLTIEPSSPILVPALELDRSSIRRHQGTQTEPTGIEDRYRLDLLAHISSQYSGYCHRCHKPLIEVPAAYMNVNGNKRQICECEMFIRFGNIDRGIQTTFWAWVPVYKTD